MLAVGAAGLNPIDLRVASGALPDRRPPLPSVVGSEGVGRADDGRRYYFSGTVKPFGSLAERTLVEADGAVEVPEGIEDGQAVACGISGTAAYGSLLRRGQLREGETVLVLGASGVVGLTAVQLAKLHGAGRVIAAARSEDGLRRAAEAGADATVSLTGDDLTAAFKDAADGEIDLVIDPLWGAPAAAAVDALAFRGRLVQLGQSAGPTAEFGSVNVRFKELVDPRLHELRIHARAAGRGAPRAVGTRGQGRADARGRGLPARPRGRGVEGAGRLAGPQARRHALTASARATAPATAHGGALVRRSSTSKPTASMRSSTRP